MANVTHALFGDDMIRVSLYTGRRVVSGREILDVSSACAARVTGHSRARVQVPVPLARVFVGTAMRSPRALRRSGWLGVCGRVRGRVQ